MKIFKIWYIGDGTTYVTTWPGCVSRKEMLDEFWDWVVFEHRWVSIDRVEEITETS